MSCDSYNLIQEGDIYNITDLSTFNPTASGLRGLYDGNLTSEAFEILASGVVVIQEEFGEYFDVCNTKWYVSPLTLSDVSISYGTASGTEFFASTVSSGTYVYAEIGQPVSFVRVTHSGSSSVSVKQWSVEGVKNQKKGFGLSPVSVLDSVFIDNSPISHFSSTPLEIPLFNDESFAADLFVSVAPTNSGSDNYVYLSTTESGTYYGINQFGVKQPSFERIGAVDDPFTYTELSALQSSWSIVRGPKVSLSATADYLQLGIKFVEATSTRLTSSPPEGVTFALVNKNRFSGDQSFTISLDVQFVSIDFETSLTANNLFFGFTNSWPIREALGVTTANWNTPSRFGRSMAAVWMGGQKTSSLKVGASALDGSYLSSTTDFSAVALDNDDGALVRPLLNVIELEDLSDSTFSESSFSDGTISSSFRTLYLSYDHILHTVYYFIDSVKLGEFIFKDEPPQEGCSFFIGYVGAGSATVRVKNFTVVKDVIRDISYKQISASASKTKDVLQGAFKLVDDSYGEANFTSGWVSDDFPEAGDTVQVVFGEERTVSSVRIKQASTINQITISGSLFSPPKYALDLVRLDFDTGDFRFVNFGNGLDPEIDGWDVRYLVNVSGTVESVDNVSDVTLNFQTFHNRGTGTPVVAVDEIQFYTIETSTVPYAVPKAVDNTFPWSRGVIKNLERKGKRNVYGVQYNNLFDVAQREDCENLVKGIDFDALGAVFSSSSLTDRSYAESVFKEIGRGTGEQIEFNTISGSNTWIWRYFDEVSDLKGVFFTVNSETLTGDSFHGKPDKWKVQYLREGGSPTAEADWFNVPPIAAAYPAAGDFTTFTQYLVDNNDGEFYTSFINAYDATGGIDNLPSDLLMVRNLFNAETSLGDFSFVADVYVEFDESIRTQGARLFVAEGYNNTSRSVPASGYTFQAVRFFRNKSSGSYLSPVLDTGTKQNTERVWSELVNYGGDSSILFRSFSTPPEFKYDPLYEVWEDFGAPFAGLAITPQVGQAFFGSVVLGDKVYLHTNQINSPVIYDYASDTWSLASSYLSEDGIFTYPDDRTSNNSVLVGTDIYIAGKSTSGNVANSSILKLITQENEFNFTGWDVLNPQRQASAVNAGMTTDGSSRLFFIGEDGVVSVFYISTEEITTENRAHMPLYGGSTRESFIPLYLNNKIYVFGGALDGLIGLPFVDVYDISSDTWSTLPNMPYNMKSTWPIVYNNYIYVLPTAQMGTFSPFLKFDFELEQWSTITSLGYNRTNYWLVADGEIVGDNQISTSYWLYGDYIYGYNSTRDNIRRFKVSREPWASGYLPDKDDSNWYGNGGIPWTEVKSFGETMSQNRFFQYKIQLDADSTGNSPVMVENVLVQPQIVSNIPASGTGSVFIKTGIEVDAAYQVWYSGTRVESNIYKDSIIYGISSNGIEFEKFQGSIVDFTLSGTDGYSFSYPTVTREETSTYEMWPSRRFRTGLETFSNASIYRSSSLDGLNWSTPTEVVYGGIEGANDVNGVYGASVIKDNGVYQMWYTGIDSLSVERILYATSTDGEVWTEHQTVQDISTPLLAGEPDMLGAKLPAVIKEADGSYKMWYQGVDIKGRSRIIYATSPNGINWTDHETAIELGSAGLYDSLGAQEPAVVKDGDTYYMWYVGASQGRKVILYAKSVGGLVWSSFVPIPVLVGADEGFYDRGLSFGSSVVLNRDTILENQILHAKLKLYD